MNCTVEEAEAFFKHFKLQKKEGVEMLICPPFTDLPLTNFFLARTSVHWGAQNVYPEEKGAFTGEISPAMLKASAAAMSSAVIRSAVRSWARAMN